MAEKLHPIVALHRVLGKGMSVREFAEWYRCERANNPRELFELAKMAIEELSLNGSSVAEEAPLIIGGANLLMFFRWNARKDAGRLA